MSPAHKNKIALIDGYGFVFRAFHSLPPLTRADGTPVGAVYGFTNMLIKLLANLNVSHIAVVFDAGSKTFRNDMYPAYKANRPPCPPELIPQFPIVREVAEALNLAILERVGFEADDLIATVAKQASREDFEVLIVSSDKDLMQLVDGQVQMYDALKNKMIGEREVEEKFFVKPGQVLDVLSLMGDASDNVPGVRGIGPKTAAELINQYQTLENLFEHLHEIKQEKRRQILTDGVEKAKLSKQLITLCETVPVSDNLHDYLLQNIDGKKLMNFLEKQGFRALVSKVKKDFNVEDEVKKDGDLFVDSSNPQVSLRTNLPFCPESITEQSAVMKVDSNFCQNDDRAQNEVKKITISDISQLKNLVRIATENGNLILDFIFEQNTPTALIISSATDSNSLKEIFYTTIINEKNYDLEGDLFAVKAEKTAEVGLRLIDVMAELKLILLDESVNKIGYKIKDLVKYFNHQLTTCDLQIKTTFNDIALMAYVLNSAENKTDLDVLVADNLSDETANNFSQNCQEIAKGKTPETFANLDKKIEFGKFIKF